MTLDFILPASDEAATEAIGRQLGARLAAGDVVFLTGPLGAGKTVLARGLIRAVAGEPIEVPSPTFSLVQSYDTSPPVTHADLFRLEDPEEVLELGLDDAAMAGVVLIEWPEMGDGFLPRGALEIAAEEGDEGRQWRFRGDAAWAARLSPEEFQ